MFVFVFSLLNLQSITTSKILSLHVDIIFPSSPQKNGSILYIITYKTVLN